MAWSSIIDQERVVGALRSTLAHGRVAHAYLFHGPDGTGKRAVALEFAKTLLCERASDEACDGCNACVKVARMVHADVHLLLAYPTDAEPDDVAERLELIGRNPYAIADFVRRPFLGDPSKSSNRQATYTVARMHGDVRRTMSFKPVEGRYQIAILTDADLLRVEASNAFLKVLEEPTSRSVFILTTSRPERLLPTILSRCQRIRFDPLVSDAIEAALVAREQVDPVAAATLARMASGSYSHAVELARNEDLLGLRSLVLDFFRTAYSGSIDKLVDQIDQIARLGRDQVKGVLDLMLRWIRDVILFRTMGEEAPIVNVDQAEALGRFRENLPNADLQAMVLLVEEAIDLVERNVHVGLTLTVLAQALGRALRGPHDGRLYVPLAEAHLSMTG